jgi:hypothetical protein
VRRGPGRAGLADGPAGGHLTDRRDHQAEHLSDAVAAVDLELGAQEIAELGADYVPHAIAGHR